MDIINKLELTTNIILTEENAYIFVHKPLTLDKLPKIDKTLVNNKYINIETEETILNYFNNLLDDYTRLYVINGLFLCNYYNDVKYICDYCQAPIKDNNWYYCYYLFKDMCNMCYEETSEEIALKNGAKNYKKRENLLNTSRMHNKLEQRSLANINNIIYSCDLCKKTIKNNYYSNENIYNSYDICMNCYETHNDAKKIIEEKNMKLIDINMKSYYFELTDFGSMLYSLVVT